MLESCSKLSLLEPGADVRNFAINQKCFFEADRFVHLRQFFCRQPGLAASDRVAVARVLDGGASHISIGSLPPCAMAASFASIHAPTAPGTVSAASGPRAGISS